MNTKDSQGKAAARMMMIAPILDESLDQRSIIELKKKLAEQHGLSYRKYKLSLSTEVLNTPWELAFR